MRLVLRRGTRTEFEALGHSIFDVADAVLITDPPTLVSCGARRDGRTETTLERNPLADVSDFIEFEVRRVDDSVIVRIGDDAWRGRSMDPIRFTFPQTLGTRPVSIGHGEI